MIVLDFSPVCNTFRETFLTNTEKWHLPALIRQTRGVGQPGLIGLPNAPRANQGLIMAIPVDGIHDQQNAPTDA